MLISEAHASCYLAFEDLLGALEGSVQDHQAGHPQKEIQEVFDKYRIWAGNVGAPHSGKRYEISLDYRLREASFFRTQVLNILGALESKVKDVTSLVRNERLPFEEMEHEFDLDTSDSADSDAPGGDDDESEDSPWDISSSSSEHSNASESARRSSPGFRGLTEVAIQEAEQPLSTALANLAQLPKSEMPRLLESIKFNISCLYRIPIRKPAPLDRIKHSSTYDFSSFQQFDVMYVRDKFPDLGAEVARRLGKMITRRRQILYYREAHKQSLDTARVQPKLVPERPAGPNTFSIYAGRETQRISSDDAPSRLALSQAASSQFTLRTKATTLQLGELDFQISHDDIDPAALYAPSVAESKSSMASSFAGKDLNVEVPPRPKGDDGKELDMFECPYCLITKSITNSHKWKKHIFEDIQPYVCTFGDCDLYDHFFDSRDAWYKHESQHHRTKWYCNAEGHEEFEDEGSFLDHMSIAHNTKFDVDQFASIKDMFRHPSRTLGGTCNLCMRNSKKLRSHVSRHLQHMALFALPRVNQTAGSVEAERNSALSRLDGDHLHNEADEADATSHSNQSSSISHESSDNITMETEDIPDIDDEFEAEDIPDAPAQNWEGITDKFSRAREPSHWLLRILTLGEASHITDSAIEAMFQLDCAHIVTFRNQEGESIFPDSADFDIVFLPHADAQRWVERYNDGSIPSTRAKVVAILDNHDFVPTEPQTFDGILNAPVGGIQILNTLIRLLHWEPPYEALRRTRFLECQMKIVQDLRRPPEFDVFEDRLAKLYLELYGALDYIKPSPYPTWEAFETRLVEIPENEDIPESFEEEPEENKADDWQDTGTRTLPSAGPAKFQRDDVVTLSDSTLEPYVGRVLNETVVAGRWWYEIKQPLRDGRWVAESAIEMAPENDLFAEILDSLNGLWPDDSLEVLTRLRGEIDGTRLAQILIDAIQARLIEAQDTDTQIALIDFAVRMDGAVVTGPLEPSVFSVFASERFNNTLLEVAMSATDRRPEVVARILMYAKNSDLKRERMEELYRKLSERSLEDGSDRKAEVHDSIGTDDDHYDPARIDHFVMPLLLKQIEILISLIDMTRKDARMRHKLILPALVKILNHLKLSAFPLLRWKTFAREITAAVAHACSGIIEDGVDDQLSWFKKRFKDILLLEVKHCPDMPLLAEDDIVLITNLENRDTVVVDRKYGESGKPVWMYLVRHKEEEEETSGRWYEEDILQLKEAGPSHRGTTYDFSIYGEEKFLPFLCWLQPECVLAFKSERERESHFNSDRRFSSGCTSQPSNPPHDRKYILEHEYAPSIKRRVGWFCRREYCIDGFPDPTLRDNHEAACKRTKSYVDHYPDASLSRDAPRSESDSSNVADFCCRDGCGEMFDKPFSDERDKHEMSCPVFPKICRNEGCVLSFEHSSARLMHERHRCAFSGRLWSQIGLERVRCTNDGCSLTFGTAAYREAHATRFCKQRNFKREDEDESDALVNEIWNLSPPQEEAFVGLGE